MLQIQVLDGDPEATGRSLGTDDRAGCVGADALLATTGTWPRIHKPVIGVKNWCNFKSGGNAIHKLFLSLNISLRHA